MDKQIKFFHKNFQFLLMVIGIILITSFVFATHTSSPETLYNIFTANDTVSSFFFNITINNTNNQNPEGNITSIIITLPTGFSYVENTNGTSNSILGGMNNTFTYVPGILTILTWTNSTLPIINGTQNNTNFWFNASVISPGTFNITVASVNGTATDITNYTIVVNDTTVPEITEDNFTSPVSSSYHDDTLLLNVSVWDNGVMGTVYFNITNSTGEWNGTFTASVNGAYYWNDSIDTTIYPDGVYNITIWSNDSAGNRNDSAKVYSVTFDNTVPSAVALASSAAATNSLTLTITFTDALSGLSSCIVDRTGASVSGTTVTETGLSCGTSYAYIATCTDGAGNSLSSSATSFSTSSCGGVPIGGGTGSSYTNTYKVTEEQFQDGYTKEIAVNHRAKVQVGASYHYVGVKAVTATTATIEITSDPVEVTLEVGGEVKMDVTEDGYYDIYVKLIDLESGKANVLIQSIYEEIPEGEGDIATSGEITGEEEEETVIEKITGKNLIWLWASIGLVLVVGLVIWLKAKRKPTSKK